MDFAQLKHDFTYHPPKGDQQKKYETLRLEALELAQLMNDFCPDSREKSIAIRKLREAIMWANASIACNE